MGNQCFLIYPIHRPLPRHLLHPHHRLRLLPHLHQLYTRSGTYWKHANRSAAAKGTKEPVDYWSTGAGAGAEELLDDDVFDL